MSRGYTASKGVCVFINPQDHYTRGRRHRYLTLLLLVILCRLDCIQSDPAQQPQGTVNTDASLHPVAGECSKPEDQAGRPRKLILELAGTEQEHDERRERAVSRSFSSLSFTNLESALLSLAFLTFAVFLVGLVQDLLNGSSTTTNGRKRSQSAASGLLKLLSEDSDDKDDRMADLIVLTLSSIDTLSYGRENPDCGRKFLCHLNRSGWHDGLLGTASNYLVSLVFSLVSPSGFQENLDAAMFGREKQDCTFRYPSCPSVIGELLPSL
ncbi:uncharacterized protein LOC126990713 [Eriocheir sinensis]|uniref:uncharacterized protein LOC126990713 n=1 Tax=Eriocheir sinensis TaxID=95602 RepID=UPI0021C93A43|nr:uncharacterized protein LOC126990713 [Eriocheir sinensis]